MQLTGHRYTICVFYRDGRDATTLTATVPNYFKPSDVAANVLGQLRDTHKVQPYHVSHTSVMQQFMFTDANSGKSFWLAMPPNTEYTDQEAIQYLLDFTCADPTYDTLSKAPESWTVTRELKYEPKYPLHGNIR